MAGRAVELGNGHVDILINNAGIFPFGPTHETTEETFDRVYSLNVKVPNSLIRETRSVNGEERQGSNCQCLDNGRGLRSVRYEPLRLKQGRYQFAYKGVDG